LFYFCSRLRADEGEHQHEEVNMTEYEEENRQGAFEFYKELPARPARPERLFFAVMPDTEESACAWQFGRQFLYKRDLNWSELGAKRLHVSLHPVGDYKRLESKHIYAAGLAADAVSMRRFEVKCSSIKSFAGAPPRRGKPPRRPLVLLCEGEGLFELHESLGTNMRQNGLKAADVFTPHMTLSYGPRLLPEEPIEPISFTAREIILIHSELWLSRYNMIGRWPLQ
jgi:RNA 2',3'-cyclic 3'-phosphodiesterase